MENHMDLSIEDLTGILGGLISELEDCPPSEGLAMAKNLVRRTLIKEIEWTDEVLGK